MSYSVKEHREFFFPDGNLILIVGHPPNSAIAFRLHRSVVNRWSNVFRSMIDACEASPTYLGCTVLVFDDDPVDFERLVRVMLDGTPVPLTCTPSTFPFITSLLTLSHKYRISTLKSHALRHLLIYYPLTLPGWDAREASVCTHDDDQLTALRTNRPHPLAVVNLALRLGMPPLLVPAYLDLARLPVSEIIKGYDVSETGGPFSESDAQQGHIPQTLQLPHSQIAAVLHGKETLQRFIADFIKASVENRPQTPLCRYAIPPHFNPPVPQPGNAQLVDPPQNPVPQAQLPPTPIHPCAKAFKRVVHEMLVMTAGVSGGVDSDPLFVLRRAGESIGGRTRGSVKQDEWNVEGKNNGDKMDEGDEKEVGAGEASMSEKQDDNGRACDACVDSFRHTILVARRHIWTCLPKWFDLRRILERGFVDEWE